MGKTTKEKTTTGDSPWWIITEDNHLGSIFKLATGQAKSKLSVVPVDVLKIIS